MLTCVLCGVKPKAGRAFHPLKTDPTALNLDPKTMWSEGKWCHTICGFGLAEPGMAYT